MIRRQTDVLVVGGGQAGLVMSHMLSRRGVQHLVIERNGIAERWRSERWDGLRFQFPNWSVSLPGFPFRHADPEAFATPAEIADYLDAYAAFVAAPVSCGVNVSRLHQGQSGGFIAETSEGGLQANAVVVATGPYQRPVIPSLSTIDVAFQVHASGYKAPQQLPPGAVLVVGSGASGVQIAEELMRAGRRVLISVGRHKRMPRRYRGRDLTWWLGALGLDQTPVERRGPDTALPLITGAYGGHTIDFRRLATQGMTLLGHLESTRGGVPTFANDLADSLAYGDSAYEAFLDVADAYVEREHLDLPFEPAARSRIAGPDCLIKPIRTIDPSTEGVSAIVWATGYTCDFSWIDMPVLDVRGSPIHRHGVSALPRLYFLGLPWLSKMNSSFLVGVGDDAAAVADHIVSHRTAMPRQNCAYTHLIRDGGKG